MIMTGKKGYNLKIFSHPFLIMSLISSFDWLREIVQLNKLN